MKAKMMKFAVKSVAGLAFSVAISTMIKLEKKVELRIDEHFLAGVDH